MCHGHHKQLTTTSKDSPLVLLTSDQVKSNNEYAEMFNNLVIEYDRRLVEQVKQAKQDVLNELEIQIQVRLRSQHILVV